VLSSHRGQSRSVLHKYYHDIFQAPSQAANVNTEIFDSEEAVAEANAKSKSVHLFEKAKL
jgi:hypothetical protein